MGLNLVRHRHKKTFLVALGPLALRMLAILICIVSRPILAADPSPEILITVKTPHGALIQAELADTSLKRAQGLMFREHLANDRGMLFIFGDAQPWTFWMKNTKIPLDIIWMDGKKTIIHIERSVPICTRQDDGCPQYHSSEGALYVLELGEGRAEALQLQRGMRLSFKQP